MCAVLPRWLSGGALRWGASVAVPAEAQSGALQSRVWNYGLTAKPTPKEGRKPKGRKEQTLRLPRLEDWRSGKHGSELESG